MRAKLLALALCMMMTATAGAQYKALIGEEDMNFYDGVGSTTFSRKTSTGGVSTMTKVGGANIGTDVSSVWRVETLVALKATTAPAFQRAVYMVGRATANDGGQGTFVWSAADLSTEVTADTLWGIYVPPNSDATGASGAWVRQYIGKASVAWWGVLNDAVDDTASMQAAVDMNLVDYSMPTGLIKLSTTITISNDVNLTGAGHINSSTAMDRGTLVWQTAAAPAFTFVSGSNENYIAHFDIVSEGDGILFFQSHRNTIEDVNVPGGTVGVGFIADESYSNRFIGCRVTTNGHSPQSYTTAHAGTMGGGFKLAKISATYGPNATELVNCYASGTDIGVYAGDVVGTYINIFGGTYEGNGINFHFKDLTSPTNVYGTHMESATTINVRIEDSAKINFYGGALYGSGASNDSLELIGSSNCTFNQTHIGYLSADSSSLHNEFRGCTTFYNETIDNGIGTVFYNHIDSTQTWAHGGIASIGNVSLVADGTFERWTSAATPGEATAQATTIVQEGAIKKFGTYSVKSTASGAYPGLRYPTITDDLFSAHMTVSVWFYIPTGAPVGGLWGIRVYGLDESVLAYDTVTNLAVSYGYDTWFKRQFTVYVGAPGSARRTGAISVAVLAGHTEIGTVGYIDGVTISDGRTQATSHMARSGEAVDLRIGVNKISYANAAPTDGVAGDIVYDESPAAGAPIGWVCTVTGTVATWVAMANL